MTNSRPKKPSSPTPTIDLEAGAAGLRPSRLPDPDKLDRFINHVLNVRDKDGKPAPLPDDLKDFQYSFLAPPKFFISVSVPESLYHRLRGYGISKFFEEATNEFDGDLKALLEAALQFIHDRKNRKPAEGICNANGRVRKESFQKIQDIQAALTGIKGLSRAKVISGLVQMKLNAMK